MSMMLIEGLSLRSVPQLRYINVRSLLADSLSLTYIEGGKTILNLRSKGGALVSTYVEDVSPAIGGYEEDLIQPEGADDFVFRVIVDGASELLLGSHVQVVKGVRLFGLSSLLIGKKAR